MRYNFIFIFSLYHNLPISSNFFKYSTSALSFSFSCSRVKGCFRGRPLSIPLALPRRSSSPVSPNSLYLLTHNKTRLLEDKPNCLAIVVLPIPSFRYIFTAFNFISKEYFFDIKITPLNRFYNSLFNCVYLTGLSSHCIELFNLYS
ncbi:putative hypothetical protein [Clostridium botulinum BKT015925]|nr:putative hypothetical protein [Clostridium botulinum BKT015925]